MANRAYLYSSDSNDYNNPDNWENLSKNGTPYYDSRWFIPYAWFFLFQPLDVKMIDIVSCGSSWQEARFFASKAIALDKFLQRQPLLLQISASPFDTETMCEKFITKLAQCSGNSLFLDPSAVFAGFVSESDDETFIHCKRILEQIEAQDVTRENIIDAIGCYSKFAFEDEISFKMNAFGATYD